MSTETKDLQIPDSLYNRYEAYDFKVMTWEEIDPETFKTDDSGDLKDYFEQFLEPKVKLFAYLGFFSAVEEINPIFVRYKKVFDKAMKALSDEKQLLDGFQTKEQFDTRNTKFTAQFGTELKAYYEMFMDNYEVLESMDRGFSVSVSNKSLVIGETISGKKKRMTKVVTWNNMNVSKLKLSAFPLIIVDGGKTFVRYVCLLDGYIRTSVDFQNDSSDKYINRFYLPVVEVKTTLKAALNEKQFTVKSFRNHISAVNNFVDSSQKAIFYNPSLGCEDISVTLKHSASDSGISIY